MISRQPATDKVNTTLSPGHCTLRGYSGDERTVGNDGIPIDLPDGSVIGLTKALPDLTESVSISGSG